MKVGDRVKLIASSYSSDFLQNGCTGTIKHEVPNGPYVVKMDSGPAPQMLPNEWGGWAFYGQQLEVIDEQV